LYGKPVDAWIYTTGNAKNDTVVTLLSPCNGWSIGDQLVFPGTGYGAVDDDLRTIQSISPDRLTITLSSPLAFDHKQATIDTVAGTLELVEKTSLTAGWDRPAFVVNRGAKRSIEFISENQAVITQRGHLMIMAMNDVVAQYCATRGYGRTDKSKTVTDPDGLGNGLANPRARYAWHFHRNGPSVSGMMAMLTGIFIDGTPGWGIVNHDSRVDCDFSAVYGYYGAGFAGEIGTETGCFCDCVAVRTTHPALASESLNDSRNVMDFGHQGHGFWLQSSAILLERCLSTGSTGSAFAVDGQQFQFPGSPTPTVFDTANLPAGYTYSRPTVAPLYVPQLHHDLTSFGCSRGLGIWSLNLNASEVYPIGRHLLHNIYSEGRYTGIFAGYSSGVDFEDVKVAATDKLYLQNNGLAHTGLNTGCGYRRWQICGFDVGMQAATFGTNVYESITIKALTGIYVRNPNTAANYRSITASSVSFLPLSTADLNAVIAATGNYTHSFFGRSFYGIGRIVQPKEQRDWMLYPDTAGSTCYGMPTVDEFGKAVASGPFISGNRYFRPDSIYVDGKYLFFPEEHPDFAISQLLNVDAVPSFLQSLTNAQMWAKHGLRMGGQILPDDAAPLPGSRAYWSTSPATELPAMQVTQSGAQVQKVKSTTGQIQVKDSHGVYQWSAPQTLTDKAWKVVYVTCDGIGRGVMVYCDTASNPAAPWSPMPVPQGN
jgi:hypothetical protein